MKTSMIHERIQFQSPIRIKKVLNLSFHACGNQHGELTLSGYLDAENAEDESMKQIEGTCFVVSASEEGAPAEMLPVFCGIASNLTVCRENNVLRITMHITGTTALLDKEPKSRSFQDISMTYRQVVQNVLSDTPHAAAKFSPIADQKIGMPLVQYQETDWEFMKRLASMAGTQLIPDCTSANPQFCFGTVGQSARMLSADEYTVMADRLFYDLGGYETGWRKPDFLCYRVPGKQYFKLGSKVSFLNQELLVCMQYGELRGGELTYTYKIGQQGLFHQREIQNKRLIGLGLPGTVKQTDGETVCLALDIDGGKDTGAYPFPWAPETGNIMYCMPKIGTRATLLFSEYYTDSAVAVSSPRENGSSCEGMTDAQNRCFTTGHGKKLCLYPQNIILSGGKPDETLQIQLNQLKCMLLESRRGIQLIAKQDVRITAPVLHVSTPEELKTSRSSSAGTMLSAIVPKGSGGKNPPTGGGAETSLIMQFQFDALGQQGILCGTEFHVYSAYDDEPKEEAFNWGGWLANIALGAVIAVACVGAVVLIPGLGAMAVGMLAGAAVGSAAVTAAIAISDYQSGEVREFGVAAKQILTGATAGAAIGGIIGGGIQSGPMILDGIKQIPGLIEAFSSVGIPLFPPSGGLVLAGGGAIGGASGITVSGQQIINGVVAGTATILANLMLSSSMSQGDSKTGNTLTDAQKSRLNSLENTINDHLTEGDFSGTLRDLQGNPVPNGKGGYFDHLGEMKDSYKSLQKIAKGLEGSLKNPNLSNVDRALLQEGLDKANTYIFRIEELFKPFGGIN